MVNGDRLYGNGTVMFLVEYLIMILSDTKLYGIYVLQFGCQELQLS